jgi:2-dehydropantoate 2-reductase
MSPGNKMPEQPSQQTSNSAEPIVMWGAGAIGGVIAAYWARAGIPVLLVDIVAEHVQACRTTGLRIEGSIDNFTQVIPAVTPDELEGVYKRIVLAVKAHATEAVLPVLLPHLAADGFILSAQNGLNELVIAEQAGAERTMGCFVNFGADWLGSGHIMYGGRGEVVVGEIDGSIQARTREMHRLLSIFEPNAILTDNIWGYLWGKLGFAAMLFATSLNNDGMDKNFSNPDHFPAFDRLGREVMAVAVARGIEPLVFPSFDPTAFLAGAPESAARASIAKLAERRKGAAKTHSGFWRDLAVRKRKTEIDPLMGKVSELARESGIPTPAVDTIIELIHDIEQGRRVQSQETFEVLLARCRECG